MMTAQIGPAVFTRALHVLLTFDLQGLGRQGAEIRSFLGVVSGVEQMFWGPVWSSLHVTASGGC